MEISELLDKAKTRASLKSDYALSKALGVKTGHVSDWRKGKRHPSNEEAVQLATLAGLEEMQVIAEIELRTANTEKKKDFWRTYIEKRGLAACLTMAGAGFLILCSPTPAEAQTIQQYAFLVEPALCQIMSCSCLPSVFLSGSCIYAVF